MLNENVGYVLDKLDGKKTTNATGEVLGSMPRSSNFLREVVLTVMFGNRSRRVPGSFVEKKYNNYFGEAEAAGRKYRKLK